MAKIAELEKQTQSPDFWNDPALAAEVSQELSGLKEERDFFLSLKKDLTDMEELASLLDENDEKQKEELENKLEELEKQTNQASLKLLLKGKHDKASAVITISAGAGGREAEDWTTMLQEMYQRYCQKKGWKTSILSQDFSEGAGPEGRLGTKEVSFEIKGRYVYGFLKNESGVHRLVRMSPFSANNLRHTSFAKVEVLPKLEEVDLKSIEIRPEDLKMDMFRSSGKGGQNVNKRETAVRLTHLPTGLVASSQVERYQARNKEIALQTLKGKIVALKEQEQKKEAERLKGNYVDTGFGHQIRSYVFQPYQLVKDLRTNVETSQINDVMQGEIDKFVEAEITL